MLKIPKLIFVIGSPRSGTSYLTNYIGKYVNYCFNEPWKLYPLGEVDKWNLPSCSVVLKYCANSLYYKKIKKKYSYARWINVVRNPFHVIYSMVFPKNNWPVKTWDKEFGDETTQRIRNAFYKWSFLSSAANFIDEAMMVRYENADIKSLSHFTGLSLNQDEYNRLFKNSNINYDESKMEFLKHTLKIYNLFDFVLDKSCK